MKYKHMVNILSAPWLKYGGLFLSCKSLLGCAFDGLILPIPIYILQPVTNEKQLFTLHELIIVTLKALSNV